MKNLYVAAVLKDLNEPYFLTSYVMYVNKDIWLFDLAGVLNYWNHHCASKKISLAILLHNIFKKIDDNYLAVLAGHPWQALLKLQDLQNKKFTGFVSLFDSFNLKIYEEISFDTWFETLEVIIPFLTDKTLLQKTELFKRSLSRLLLSKIGSLKNFAEPSLKRRYGKTLSMILRWTFKGNESAFFLSDFPWQMFKRKIIPEVKRSLEYYVNSWGEVAFLLSDDLDILSSLISLSVLKLKWIITLENLQVMTFDIDFRNPHRLSSELKTHDTSLAQFQNAFEKLSSTFKDSDESLMVSSWRIVADQMMSASVIKHDFFADSHLEDILNLENKLGAPLIRYRLTEDFTPEYAFETCGYSVESPKNSCGLQPLFILARPVEIPEQKRTDLLFTERVTTHWWEEDYQVRDYFLEESVQARWIFFDNISKKWYEHGHFG